MAGVAVFALSFFTADLTIEYLSRDLAGRGINPFVVHEDLSLSAEIAWDVLLLTALIGCALAITVWVMKKRPTYPKPAVSAPLAGLVAGCAGGVLIGRVAFETVVNGYGLPFASRVDVGGYISFLFKFTLFTGMSSAVFVLFVALFATVKWRFRALFLLPALAVVIYYHITTFPIVG